MRCDYTDMIMMCKLSLPIAIGKLESSISVHGVLNCSLPL